MTICVLISGFMAFNARKQTADVSTPMFAVLKMLDQSEKKFMVSCCLVLKTDKSDSDPSGKRPLFSRKIFCATLIFSLQRVWKATRLQENRINLGTQRQSSKCGTARVQGVRRAWYNDQYSLQHICVHWKHLKHWMLLSGEVRFFAYCMCGLAERPWNWLEAQFLNPLMFLFAEKLLSPFNDERKHFESLWSNSVAGSKNSTSRKRVIFFSLHDVVQTECLQNRAMQACLFVIGSVRRRWNDSIYDSACSTWRWMHQQRVHFPCWCTQQTVTNHTRKSWPFLLHCSHGLDAISCFSGLFSWTRTQKQWLSNCNDTSFPSFDPSNLTQQHVLCEMDLEIGSIEQQGNT